LLISLRINCLTHAENVSPLFFASVTAAPYVRLGIDIALMV